MLETTIKHSTMTYLQRSGGGVKGGSVVACAGHATYVYSINREYIGYSAILSYSEVLVGPRSEKSEYSEVRKSECSFIFCYIVYTT